MIQWFRNKSGNRKYSLNQLYQVIGLSKQAVSQYLFKQAKFEQSLCDLLIEVDELRAEHPGCGLEKMYYTLAPSSLGRDRFIAVLSQMGYGVVKVKNFMKTTKPVHSSYQNLIEGMIVTRINQVLQSDITYYYTDKQFYYIVFIIDVYSKRIVGFKASEHLRAEANIMALEQVIKLRGKTNLSNTIHHSDRGSQYIAKKYRNLLERHNIHISMGDNAMDNAYAERINGIIKNEYLKYQAITDLVTLKKQLRKAVKHYNHKRIHNHLPNRMTPVSFENALSNKTLKTVHLELIYAKENNVKRNKLKTFLPLMDIQSNQLCPIFY